MENKQDKGFTLVELLIVIVILGILATVTVFAVRGITDQGQDIGLRRRPEDPADGRRGLLRPVRQQRRPRRVRAAGFGPPRTGFGSRPTTASTRPAWSFATAGGKCV